MTTDNRKIQLETEVVDGSKAGFDSMKRNAAEAAAAVEQSATKASKSVGGIGDGADKSAQKLEQSTRSIIGSVERATAALQAGERGSAKYFETLASQRGVNADVLKPYLEQLRQAEALQQRAQGSLNTMGVSAKQTAAALRGVPAQFTDIVTSLQGGQAPLTVFLQQGGQLKDLFGGAGNAAKALGGYVLGLVNPFTVTAAAVAVLTLAYKQGRDESLLLERALQGNGARLGATVSQINEMAKALGGSGFTRGAAASALAEIASTGAVSRDSLQSFTATALDLEKYVGQSVSKTADAFKSLADEPAKATLKLNESLNYLTAAQYEQIKSLEDMGRKTDAARIAQQLYSEAVKPTIDQYKSNLGYLDTALDFYTKGGKKMWDALTGLGRTDTTAERIAKLKQELGQLSGPVPFRDVGILDAIRGAHDPSGTQARLINQKQGELTLLERLNQATQENAKFEGERQARQQAGIRWAQEGEKYLDKESKLRLEITRIRNEGAAAGASEDAINTRIAAARENASRDQSKAAKDAARDLEKYRDLLDSLAGKSDGISANFGEQVALLGRYAKMGTAEWDRYFELLLGQQPFATKAVKEQAEAEKLMADARARITKGLDDQYQAEVRAAQQSAKGAKERVQALVDEETALDLSRLLNISLAAAIEEVRIARLQDALAVANSGQQREKVREIEAEIKARRELAVFTDRKKGRDESSSAYDDIMKSKVGNDYAAGFDKASASMGTFVDTFGRLIDAQKQYNKARSDQGRSTQQIAALDAKFSRDQISYYASLTGAAKGFFKEKTGAYKALEAAEQGLRVAQLASTIQSVASSFTEGTAKAAVGVANQANGDPYSAFPRMAAMAAVMATLGFAVAGSFSGKGSGIDVAKIQEAQGTGTVFGDSSAKSESLKKSLEHLEDIASPQLRYTLQMVGYLRSIDSSLQGVTGQILRTGGGLTGAGFVGNTTQNMASLIKAQASTLGVFLQGGVLGSVVDKLTGGLLGSLSSKILGGLFGSTKTTLADSGLQFGAESLASILATGVDASGYQTIDTTKKKNFGLSKSTSTSTNYNPVDAAITGQFTQLVKDIYGSVSTATEALGVSAEDVKARLLGVTVDLGRISLKGLNGTQIQEQLTAVFGAFGDRLAAAADSSATEFQRVGEGYFETLIRVASGLEEGQSALRRMGIAAVGLTAVVNKQGDVAAEVVRQSILAVDGLGGVADIIKSLGGNASDIGETYKSLTDIRTALRLMGFDAASVGSSLIDGAGGLQELTDAVSSFQSNFLSESEQIAIKSGTMALAFQRLGLALPDSGESYAALVKGIDTSTDAGKLLLGQVLGLSNGFGDLLSAIKEVGSGIQSEIERIKGLTAAGVGGSYIELQTSFAINSAKARAGDQAAIDLLPQISQALLKAAEATAGSSLDVAVIQAKTLASLQATLSVISDPNKRLTGLPGFASGGNFAGGWRVVGEQGREIEATGPSRIFNAADTARILGGSGGGNAELIAEVRALRAEVASLREDQMTGFHAVAANTGKAARILESVTPSGNSISTVAGT